MQRQRKDKGKDGEKGKVKNPNESGKKTEGDAPKGKGKKQEQRKKRTQGAPTTRSAYSAGASDSERSRTAFALWTDAHEASVEFRQWRGSVRGSA